MSSSKQKSIVITGTSTGIGEETAKLFSKKGWIVFAGVRKQADADRLQSYGVNIKPLILDVTHPDQITKAFEEVRVAVGEDGLDALVNNAGTAFIGPTEFTAMTDVEKQFELNFFGVIRVTQAAMPFLRLGKAGHIVNVSSIASELNTQFGGFYCATKAAVDSMSESFRREVAKWGIKVSVLKPGPVETKFHDTASKQVAEIQSKFPPGSKADEFYGKTMIHFDKVFEKMKLMGMASPSASAGVIYSAITARNPRNLYCDTWGTWLTMALVSWFPTWLMDAAFDFLFA